MKANLATTKQEYAWAWHLFYKSRNKNIIWEPQC